MNLRTARLRLRPYEPDDLTAIAAIFSDPEVRRFFPAVLSLEQTASMIANAIALTAANGFHFGVAILIETGEIVGHVGLGVIPNDIQAAIPGRPGVEVGWVFARACWGRGLAPEAARAWLTYGFDSLALPEIVAFTARINAPSRRVMEKLGMRREAADDFEHPRLPDGHALRPHVVYRLANPASVSSSAPL